MRKFLCLLLPLAGIFLWFSCNKDEGLGGSSSIEGYVYKVVHHGDDFSFIPDTIPAAGERIYIIYGNNEQGPVASKDVRTNLNGLFCFEFLRSGEYIVYAFSEYPNELSNLKVAEVKHIKVGSGTAKADPIYIHSGKGYGLSMIKGKLMVQYYYRGYPEGEPQPAAGERVYLKRFGEDVIMDDVRVSDQGVFLFDRVVPGKYEVYAITQEIDDRRFTYPTPSQIIEVKDPHKVYEVPEVITIDLNL